ncbi:hypothetical protein DPMN_052997 [Dreissena polymorpha]|uniref:Uncharacterized protein n=1 Tax=Dreissena polymorpha TaxID=45954 RepID=A0A9D4CMW7_DREPO|nr:hypothetical protein DPMN_052997 [Dreissena polymorpha]
MAHVWPTKTGYGPCVAYQDWIRPMCGLELSDWIWPMCGLPRLDMAHVWSNKTGYGLCVA